MTYPPNASHAAYPHLRQCLAPQYGDALAEDIESYMDQRFGSGAADHYEEYLEGFFDDIGRALQRAAPVVANVAGGMVRGGMAGSSLGLPGIIGGAVVGGAGTAMSSYGSGSLRDVGNALNTGTKVASQFSPMGQVGDQLGSSLSSLGQGRITPQRLVQQGGQLLSSAGQAGLGGRAAPMVASIGGLLGQGGGGAAGQLASLLGRPEVQQALMAMLIGPAGRRTVPVGGAQTPVPTTAIAGLLQNLSAQAVSEAAAWGEGAESDLAYMADARGEFVGDPSEEDDRAARVWDLLNHAQLERLTAAAMQAATGPQRHGYSPMPDYWRAALTEDMLAGFGEFDGEAEFTSAEFEGEAWGDEAWGDEAADWAPEAQHG